MWFLYFRRLILIFLALTPTGIYSKCCLLYQQNKNCPHQPTIKFTIVPANQFSPSAGTRMFDWTQRMNGSNPRNLIFGWSGQFLFSRKSNFDF